VETFRGNWRQQAASCNHSSECSRVLTSRRVIELTIVDVVAILRGTPSAGPSQHPLRYNRDSYVFVDMTIAGINWNLTLYLTLDALTGDSDTVLWGRGLVD